MKKTAITTILLLALPIMLSAQTGLTGKWQGKTPMSSSDVLLDLSVEQETLTGTLTDNGNTTTITNGKVSLEKKPIVQLPVIMICFLYPLVHGQTGELVKKYDSADLDKAIQNQETICKVDKTAEALRKLEDLKFEREKRKLPTIFYPAEIADIVSRFPEKSRQLQGIAAYNQAARDRQETENRRRTEEERKRGEEERRKAEISQFVKIPAGEFIMGSTNGGSDEKPVHRVRTR